MSRKNSDYSYLKTIISKKILTYGLSSHFLLVLEVKVYYNVDYSNYLKTAYFSYPERLRDWPNEVSATGLIEDTVLIPRGDKRLEDEKIVFVFQEPSS